MVIAVADNILLYKMFDLSRQQQNLFENVRLTNTIDLYLVPPGIPALIKQCFTQHNRLTN